MGRVSESDRSGYRGQGVRPGYPCVRGRGGRGCGVCCGCGGAGVVLCACVVCVGVVFSMQLACDLACVGRCLGYWKVARAVVGSRGRNRIVVSRRQQRARQLAFERRTSHFARCEEFSLLCAKHNR